jgi:hypothetical protein
MDAILIENRKVQRRFMGTFTAMISKLRRIFAATLIFVWVIAMFTASSCSLIRKNFSNFPSFPKPKTKKQHPKKNVQGHFETRESSQLLSTTPTTFAMIYSTLPPNLKILHFYRNQLRFIDSLAFQI